MHHSRNSQQKAWDETLVLALAGMGKLLRSHFLIIAVMPDFPLVGSYPQEGYLYELGMQKEPWDTGQEHRLQNQGLLLKDSNDAF